MTISVSEDADTKAWVQDAVSAVEFPSKAKGSLGWHTAFRAILTRLREDGRNGVATTTLQTVANSEEPRFEWGWCETVLPWAPGVQYERGGVWKFDPADTEREQPTAPDDVDAPSDERIADMVEASDFPGDGTTPARHRNAVREAYSHLIRHGTATRDDLRQYVELRSTYDKPEQGYFLNERQWWRHVGRPALADLPGVVTPNAPGGEWTFVGVEPRVNADE
ncbi:MULTISPECIES: hypothetical protein [Halobacterium]|uniref:hypothetical protein n=1 Tax=Halobacterium TaxID=2239 RepID=UPI001962BBAC|nr:MULTISPECIES: hypothetical protein [Halobacterium]MDL0144917.1 hypothetical protein [Halobacterium salinarum]QRY23551.1 hypothetical protein JT689_05855 [Halobacterium sp. GSL-19]